MKKLTLMFATLVILAACSKNDADKLAAKKSELAKLQSEEKALLAKIKTLESELELLEPKKAEEKVIAVTVSPIISQDFNHFVEIQGRVDAKNNVFVSPQTGGAITNLFVKEGDFVKQGQTIATIDNAILKQSLQEIEVQLGTAKVFYEKQKSLWEQKIGTEVQFIQAKANVDALEKRIATLQTQLTLNKVVSPISGFVDEVRLKAGEMASPGLGIVRVVNSDNLKVIAQVADTYASTIKQGDLVKIKFPDLGKETNAKLSFVGQTVNPASRTFTVEAAIAKIDSKLKPNMSALLNINDQAKGNAIIINQNYIQHTEQGDIVYVAVSEGAKKVAKARVVSTGITYNGDIEITSGLQAGDLLITQGYQDLVDGQAVSF